MESNCLITICKPYEVTCKGALERKPGALVLYITVPPSRNHRLNCPVHIISERKRKEGRWTNEAESYMMMPVTGKVQNSYGIQDRRFYAEHSYIALLFYTVGSDCLD